MVGRKAFEEKKFYWNKKNLALPVNARCTEDAQCGVNKQCIGHLCECNVGKKVENANDIYGRVFQSCVSGKILLINCFFLY